LSWIHADKVFSGGGKEGLPQADLHHLVMFLAGKQRNAPQALQVLDIVLHELPTARYLLRLVANHVLLYCFSNCIG
jgi:hypothetical protein